MNLIYITTNLITKKQYVGSHYTEKIDDGYLGSGIVLNQSIKKHGKHNFKREIIEYCDDLIQARKLEGYYIKKFNTLLPNGYNMNYTGSGFGSDDKNPTKGKFGIKNPNFGSKRSEETRKKISESNKNKPKSNKHKKSLSKAWDKRRIEYPISEETKQKMSKSSKGKINIKFFKVIDPDGNEYITTNGLSKFCEEHNLTVTLLHKVAMGKRKHHKNWKCYKINPE